MTVKTICFYVYLKIMQSWHHLCSRVLVTPIILPCLVGTERCSKCIAGSYVCLAATQQQLTDGIVALASQMTQAHCIPVIVGYGQCAHGPSCFSGLFVLVRLKSWTCSELGPYDLELSRLPNANAGSSLTLRSSDPHTAENSHGWAALNLQGSSVGRPVCVCAQQMSYYNPDVLLY